MATEADVGLERAAEGCQRCGAPSWDGDDEGWLAQLRDEGYAVVRGCADAAHVEAARELMWDALERTTTARRDDLASWREWRLDQRGFALHGTVTQGAGAWSVRSLPLIRRAFERIWNTEELISSMDAVLVWKPWWRAEEVGASTASWRPKVEGLHVDQNPLKKPDFACVQGMVPLFDVTETTGGLQVVPASHLPGAQRLITDRLGDDLQKLGDFVVLPFDAIAGPPKLIEARAGDLILWDSRTTHGGRVGSGSAAVVEPGPPQLARLAIPVCMTPRHMASAEVLSNRRQMFEAGQTTNHWPHQPRVQCKVCFNYSPIILSAEQEALL